MGGRSAGAGRSSRAPAGSPSSATLAAERAPESPPSSRVRRRLAVLGKREPRPGWRGASLAATSLCTPCGDGGVHAEAGLSRLVGASRTAMLWYAMLESMRGDTRTSVRSAGSGTPSGVVSWPAIAHRRGDKREPSASPTTGRARSRDAAASSRPRRVRAAVACALATAGGRGRPAAAAGGSAAAGTAAACVAGWGAPFAGGAATPISATGRGPRAVNKGVTQGGFGMSCQSRCLPAPMPEHARSSPLVVGHRARMLSSVVFGKTRKAQFTHPRWFIVWIRQARSRSLAKPLARAARPGASPARGSSIATAVRARRPSSPRVRSVWSWFVPTTVGRTSP